MSEQNSIEEWLAAHPHGPGRRVARETSRAVLVSKFEPGFFEQLDETLQLLPALFDPAAVSAAYWTASAVAPTRAEAWRRGMEALLLQSESGGSMDARQRAEVMAGVDSVAALLEGTFWTDPGASIPWTASEAELKAIDELAGRLAPDGDLFTRHYGSFEGKPVANHCPGSRYARRLFDLALATILGS